MGFIAIEATSVVRNKTIGLLEVIKLLAIV